MKRIHRMGLKLVGAAMVSAISPKKQRAIVRRMLLAIVVVAPLIMRGHGQNLQDEAKPAAG